MDDVDLHIFNIEMYDVYCTYNVNDIPNRCTKGMSYIEQHTIMDTYVLYL